MVKCSLRAVNLRSDGDYRKRRYSNAASAMHHPVCGKMSSAGPCSTDQKELGERSSARSAARSACRDDRRQRSPALGSSAVSAGRVRGPCPGAVSEGRVRGPCPGAVSRGRVLGPCPRSVSAGRVRGPCPRAETSGQIRRSIFSCSSDRSVPPPSPSASIAGRGTGVTAASFLSSHDFCWESVVRNRRQRGQL